MAKTKRYRYNGPPKRVVVLDLEVTDGDELYGPSELDTTDGFSAVSDSKGSDKALLNEKEDVKDVDVGGSGEQTEEDH